MRRRRVFCFCNGRKRGKVLKIIYVYISKKTYLMFDKKKIKKIKNEKK